jgi:hypothetical protein
MHEKTTSQPSKVKFKYDLGKFDYPRIAREMGGLVPWEDIGEILSATKNNSHLIYFLLCAFVKDPRRIAIRYQGKSARLRGYRISPDLDYDLEVSLMSGTVLSKSWGKPRGDWLKNGIFDVAQIVHRLERKDFPQVYRIVREAYDDFKRRPPLSEAQAREIVI